MFRSFCIFEQSREALNWPQAKGRMISSLLVIDHAPDFLAFTTTPFRWYGTQVEYEFSVGGNAYFSDRLSFQNGDVRSPRTALKVMNKYRRLHDVIVYYDPKDPHLSVLEPEDIGDIFIPIMLGGLLVLCGLFGFYSRSSTLNRGLSSSIYQGQIYQEQGKWQEALGQYTQAISSNPNLAFGYSSRGNLYLYHQNWDQAIADFNRAIAIDPNDALAYFTLAKAYIGKEQYEEAWINMQKAMDKGFNVNPELLEDIKSKLP